MRVVIVDDEPLARRELRRLLAEFPWVEIADEAGDVASGVAAIERTAPELLFLDVQMPGGSGFDILELVSRLPRVIFTTAYDCHAVRAFEVAALDYLLKPIEPDRLAVALDRVRARASEPSQQPPQKEPLEQVFIRVGTQAWLVPLRQVRLIAADGNYVRLFWNNSKPLLRRALSSIEQRLDRKRFFRASRRHIVNLDFVEGVELGPAGRLYVQLRGGPEVEVSRRQAKLFRTLTAV